MAEPDEKQVLAKGPEATEAKAPEHPDTVNKDTGATEGSPASTGAQDTPSRPHGNGPGDAAPGGGSAEASKAQRKAKPPSTPKAEKDGPAGERRPAQERRSVDIHPDIEKEIGTIDPLTLTREQMVQLIIRRHELTIRALLDKIKENNKFISENQDMMEEERKKRDKLNSAVSELKEKRQSAQSETKKLREELFSLLERDTDVDKITKELDVYKRHMEDVDWKLQTTAITLDRERELMEEIRQSMKKITELSKDIQAKQGIFEKVKDISGKIDGGFASAQDFHVSMLELVSQAEGHHSKWAEVKREVSDRQRQNSWMEHRMKMHSENLTYWQGIAAGGKQ